MRAWFSEERMQQLVYFSLFIAIEDVNAFRNCIIRVLKQIHKPFGISINPLYFSDSFMSIFLKNTEDSNEMAHNAAFYQCLH